MKMEIRIGGKVLVIEAEGVVSFSVRDEAQAVPVAPVVPAAAPLPEAADGGLFARLAELRRELATAANVPPYVVFKDVTLREMAERMPADMAALSHISGVGQAKLDKYGEAFLAVINEGEAA